MKLTTTLAALLLLLSATYLQGQAYDIKEVSLTNFPIALQEVGEQLKHEKIEWFADKRRFLWVANIEKKDRTETVIRTIGYEDTTNVVLTVKTAKKQTLQIKNLLALPASRMFLYGEYYCTKNPTKKLYNWYAICDGNGQIIVQKKTKYKGYQTACLMNGKEIGLLYNPIKKDTFTNRPVVDVLNWETFKIDRSIVLEMKKNQAAFVNSVVFDQSSNFFLAFGRYMSVNNNRGFFDKFDESGSYMASLMREDARNNFIVQKPPVHIPYIPYTGSYMLDVPYRYNTDTVENGRINIMTTGEVAECKGYDYANFDIKSMNCISPGFMNVILGGGELDFNDLEQPNFRVYATMPYSEGDFFILNERISITATNWLSKDTDEKILEPYIDAGLLHQGRVVLIKHKEELNTDNDMEVDVVIYYTSEDKVKHTIVMLTLIHKENSDYYETED